MKTLRDTNNNNSNTTSNTVQEHFSSAAIRQNSTTEDWDTGNCSLSSSQNRLRQQTIRHTNEQSSNNFHTSQRTSSSKLSTQTNNSINSNSFQSPLNPYASIFNGDPNQWSSIFQTYLSKIGGNQTLPFDAFNPLLYLQVMNANTMYMQQLSAIQNHTFSTHSHPIKHHQSSTTLDNQQIPMSNIDLPVETINSGRNSQILQADSNIFVPKTRPMTQDEIAEHARLVYQRALQRNQLQQHTDLMKHFYETLTIKQQDSSTDRNEVPSVPNVSKIASIGTFDVLDTMITSPSSCLSVKEPSIDAALSSLSLLSVDDAKMISKTNSILDPGAPIFIPRQNRLKLDDDNETSSSSSDSDFNDFHYLDQFLDEFYNSNNEHDNHLIIGKSLSSETANNSGEVSNNKHPLNHNTLGQGDVIEEIIEQPLSTTIEKQECQYSIYDLLNRYRNPRCHLVLPEWSRLSLILPNVCSMRGHTYKIKRYFAYRRRLHEDEHVNKDVNMSISVRG